MTQTTETEQEAQYQNQLGNVCVQKQDFDQALRHYANAVQLQPDYVAAHYNLGLLFLKTGQWDFADKQFHNVIQLAPHMTQAYYYLGTIALQQKNFESAITHYAAVLEEIPEHLEALNNLGAAYLHQQQYAEALQQFNAVLQQDERHRDARNNMAAACLYLDRFEDAIKHYQILLQQGLSDDVEIYFNLGVALMSLGHLQEAIQQFHQVIQLQKDHTDAYTNLGACHHKLKQTARAIQYYLQALQQQPNNASIQFMLQALSGSEQPKIAPPDYVKHLFDNYAFTFEQHLREELHYVGPELLQKAISEIPNFNPAALNILDLGCGTGLCGELFRPWARQLVGVDLSEKMSAKAKQKNVYDALYVADMTEFLISKTNAWDLILAADVFTYVGDITALLQACYQGLRSGGLLAFTTEITDQASYLLQTSGRYAHNQLYLQTSGQSIGFNMLRCETVVVRQQDNAPLSSYLLIWQKPAGIDHSQ